MGITSEKKQAFFGVYGCQMNISDAERMEGRLAEIGYERTEDMATADLILLVTCCVRESAEDRIYGKIGEIKHLKRQNPKLIFGIAGCMAQKEGEKLIQRAPHIDFVLGTNREHQIADVVRELEEERGKRTPVVDIELGEAHLPGSAPVARAGTISAWIPIMYGCNNFCTYCIVPYVRGRERSRVPEDILREAEDAVQHGYREITLLGQNVNSYGKDHGKADFAALLSMADGIPGIARVRYMTSHPKDLSDRVISAVASGKHICEHFHLPVQYGTDRILRKMNRVYTLDGYRRLIARIRDAVPQASITTDLIVGFPGETEEDFGALLDFLREIRYDAAYTFLYSRRSGTPAAEMPDQVPEDCKKSRLQRLMDVQNEISLEINRKLQGRTMEVLVEGPSRSDAAIWTGRTRTNKIVLWPHGESEREGDLVQVKITQPQTWVLKGELQ